MQAAFRHGTPSLTFLPWDDEVSYSKSPRIRTYFFESQAEIGSYFKGTKTNYKV